MEKPTPPKIRHFDEYTEVGGPDQQDPLNRFLRTMLVIVFALWCVGMVGFAVFLFLQFFM